MKRHLKSLPWTKQTPPDPKPSKRPQHKARLAQERLNAATNAKHPEPMSLMHKREKAGEIPAHVLPKPLHTLGKIDNAATAMAQWDLSDPFSYNRTALYVKQGYVHPDDVVKEMTTRTIARRAARAKEVDNAKSTAN
jgi:hypothetical protein